MTALSTSLSNISTLTTHADELQPSQLLYLMSFHILYRLMWQMAQQSNGVLMASCGKVKVEPSVCCMSSGRAWFGIHIWWPDVCDLLSCRLPVCMNIVLAWKELITATQVTWDLYWIIARLYTSRACLDWEVISDR